jgi:hypothetical protein
MSTARSDEFIENLEGRLLLSAASLRHASKARHSHTAAAIVQSVSHAKKTVATPKVTAAAATTTSTTDPAGGPDGENVDGGPTGGGTDTTADSGTQDTTETGGTSETGDTTATAAVAKPAVKASRHARRR